MANEQNIIPNSERTPQERQEIARAGGIASGKARRERKSIADALRLVLDEKAAPGSETSRLDAIVAKVVKNLYDTGDIRDLKTLADLLGESVQNINLQSNEPFRVEVQDEAEKAKIQKLLDRQ